MSPVHYTLHHTPTPIAAHSTPPLSLTVSLRRGRAAASALVAVSVVVVLTAVFRDGVVLESFDITSKTAEQRAELLDKYNSYSGNGAAVLGRPLEILIAVMAQIVVLRLMAPSLLRPTLSWSITGVTMGVAALVAFLINSGFNAMNVQLREVEPRPKILASDLSATAVNASVSARLLTNVTHSVAETQPGNPITNTLLRNLVLPRVPTVAPLCTNSYSDRARFADDAVDYGFAQRDWMATMLPEALAARMLRVVVNATDAAANKDVSPDRLPMNASRAADLFLTSVLLSDRYIPWGRRTSWLDAAGIYAQSNTTFNVAAAIVAGLLPPDNATAQAAQRAWFLRESAGFFNHRPISKTNMTASVIGMAFTHVDITPSIAFDSITWEIDVDPAALTTVYASADNNRTRFTTFPNGQCGPWPATCTVARESTDTPVAIHAYAVCTSADGTETLRSQARGNTLYDYFIQCPNTSNNSILLVSASRRLVADALTENATANASGIFPSTSGAVATNLRKIYSFTVGRLGWAWQDLAAKYSAECLLAGDCTGLDYTLGESRQQFVVGAAAVPTTLLSGPNYMARFEELDQHPQPVVTLLQPPSDAHGQNSNSVVGDLLLLHNVKNISWDMSRRITGKDCQVVQEDRQQLVLNNHLYMESTLQTTYTAGVLFLFQNAVVKRAVALHGNAAASLAFDGNAQFVAVRISIPNWNAILTLLGCLLLVGGLGVAMLWTTVFAGRHRPDPLANITEPHVIARVMLDNQTFPQLLLHRRVVCPAGEFGCASGDKAARRVDEFVIESLQLRDHESLDSRRRVVANPVRALEI